MGARVMVVDDSAMSRGVLRRMLQGAGHEVLEASDGMAALERYALDRPAVVFLDLVMSGMYGLDVLRELRWLDPGARVVIASADIQQATRDEALAAGALGFVAKPLARDAVLAALDAALGGAGATP